MSSRSDPEARWSLTRRLAWIFSVTTCLLLGIQTVGSCYFVFDTLRDELGMLIEHEATEFRLALEDVERSPGAAVEVTRRLAASFGEPDAAFRVRTTWGEVVAAAGDEALLARDWTPVDVGERAPRDPFTWDRLGATLPTADGALLMDVVIEGRAQQRRLREFLGVATLGFLVMAVLSGLAGWFVAARGMRWLRAVVSQARLIDLPAGSTSIRLDDPPEEMGELAAALNAMLERIDTRLREMRTFTAGLAHELRSPLQNLVGETEVALMAPRPRDEYVRLLRSNLEELQDLSSAVGNLVTFCRTSEPRPREPVLQPFDARDEAVLVLDGQARHAERLGVTLDLRASGDTAWLGDRESYLRVLRNLVDNATSCSPHGGTVAVVLRGDEHALSLVVEDEGPGVPEALRERIYDPFVTGRAREGRRGGYGLGLAICRTLVGEAGGTIRHEAREGGGTRFVVELPRRRPAA